VYKRQGQDYVYKGRTVFKGLHQHDTLTLSSKQQTAFLKEDVSDIFPEYYIIKVNKFNNVATDSLDQWIYFLKNSEVKDEFNAKGLKQAGEVLDIMRLNEDDQYSYNRYMEYLSYKASEILSLKSEAEDRVRQSRNIEIAKNAIIKGADDQFIADITGLSLEQILEIRMNLGL
jgi:hypothetical protein